MSSYELDDLLALLRVVDAAEGEKIRRDAEAVKLAEVGPAVYVRGLIEVSNRCRKNCSYCGIRSGNHAIRRYTLEPEEIVAAAELAERQRFGSIVLQSGERKDERFVSFIETVIHRIRERTSLGITLSMGEQSVSTYRRWFAAGAHRYLLRIETSNRELYARLHPPTHRFDARLQCLHDLRDIGYIVGTGVLIGVPGQTDEDLARDLILMRDLDVDMIGMGPWVPHSQTPLANAPALPSTRRLQLSLRMISLARLLLRDVNIASTTALETIHPKGRELGLAAGANVVMPNITPEDVRGHYALYDGKPQTGGLALDTLPIAWGQRGDPVHVRRRG